MGALTIVDIKPALAVTPEKDNKSYWGVRTKNQDKLNLT